MGKKVYKVVLAGEGGVGKTSMITFSDKGKFRENEQMTVGVNIGCYTPEDFPGILQLWDLGGQERFECIHKGYTGCAHAGILVFDHSRFKTFMNIPKWEQFIRQDNGNIPILLVGNKVDLIESGKHDGIPQEDIDALMKENNYFGYFSTSCKTGKNVSSIFDRIAAKLGNGCS